MDKLTAPIAFAAALTAGEFTFAFYLLFSHGEWFAAYLAITYFVREHAAHYDHVTWQWARHKLNEHLKG